jgi:hypothetical protein
MNAAKRQNEWTNFLKFFSEQNVGKPTRLGVFETNTSVVNDLWLECGLPLVGVDIDADGVTPAVQIMVGSLLHEIKNAVKLSCHLSASGDEDGLDVLDNYGRMTVLRFEERRPTDHINTVGCPAIPVADDRKP